MQFIPQIHFQRGGTKEGDHERYRYIVKGSSLKFIGNLDGLESKVLQIGNTALKT